jgi:hypothetical protein
MASTTQNIEKQIKAWEHTREKGQKNYIIKRWVIPYGIFLPLMTITGGAIFSLTQGISIKAWGVFATVFEPIFMLLSVFAGKASWRTLEE